MKRTLLISLTLLLFLGRSFAQEVDEFQIEDLPSNINQSKDEFDLDDEEASPVPEHSAISEDQSAVNPSDLKNETTDTVNTQMNDTETSFDLSREESDDTVLVREKVEDSQTPALEPGTELVEIRYPQDVFLPYKQRQKNWGWLFSLGTENTNFSNLVSQLDNTTFNELFGQSVTTFSIELGPKYNTPAGSFALVAGYGSIDAQERKIGTESSLQMTRYSLSVAYFLDMLFPEPYIVPYVSAGMWQADYRETSEEYPGETGRYSTEPGTQWKLGALFNLDWIEPDRSRESRKDTGMQGTFINVYALSTQMSETNPDPDLSTDMDIGAALVIEF